MKFLPFGKVHLVDHYSVVEDAATRVAAVREAVGSGVDILLDFHGRVSPAMAVWLEEAMRPYHPLFIEEPVLPENIDALARWRSSSRLRWLRASASSRSGPSGMCWRKGQPAFCNRIRVSAAESWNPLISRRWRNATMPRSSAQSIRPHQSGGGPSNRRLHSNFLIQEYVHLGEGYLLNPFEIKMDT